MQTTTNTNTVNTGPANSQLHRDAQLALEVLVKNANNNFGPAKELYKEFILQGVLQNYKPTPIAVGNLIAKYEEQLGYHWHDITARYNNKH